MNNYCILNIIIYRDDYISVVNTMNEKFRTCLSECKQLNSAGLLHQTGATADKILYNHAIQMVSIWEISFTFFFF